MTMKGPKTSDLVPVRETRLNNLCAHYKVEVDSCHCSVDIFQSNAPKEDPQIVTESALKGSLSLGSCEPLYEGIVNQEQLSSNTTGQSNDIPAHALKKRNMNLFPHLLTISRVPIKF